VALTGDAAGQAKREAIELIHRLPDEATLADIIDALILKLKVDEGLQDVAEGRVISHEEVMRRLRTWRASEGH